VLLHGCEVPGGDLNKDAKEQKPYLTVQRVLPSSEFIVRAEYIASEVPL
jgi:hypothetical protein